MALLFLVITLAWPAASHRTAWAQEGDGTVTASFAVIGPLVVVDTTINPSPPELSDLEAAIEPIVGVDLTLTTSPIEIISSITPGSELTIPLPLTGAPEGLFSWDINFVVDNLAVETMAGLTTATVEFSALLTLEADASIAGTDEGGINLNLSDPHLLFTPPDPSVALLTGGGLTVTVIGASFDLEIADLPDGAALVATFSKDPSVLLSVPGTNFLLMADSVAAEIGWLGTNVAFGISVVKTGIGNGDLGDNLIRLEVRKAWFDARIAEGKRILISKFDDAGDPVPTPQDVTGSCTSATDPVVCSATLSGPLAGPSTFFLAAMTLENAPPIAVAGFTPLTVTPGEGISSIAATATDPNEDPLAIDSFLVTPSLTGLEIELTVQPLINVSFKIEAGSIEVKGPEPELVLASLQELGGFAVEDAQIVEIEIEVGPNVTLASQMDGSLKVEAAAITLNVVATDPLGQSSTAISTPTFPPATLASPEDNRDDNQDNDDVGRGIGRGGNFLNRNSQTRVRILSNQETRISTPDGLVEIFIPADFLSSRENGRIVELELNHLDPERSSIDGEILMPIRSIEVNALVDGADGSIFLGQDAKLIIPLTSQDMEMAGGNLSSLAVVQLNPVTGAWKSLPAVVNNGSTPSRLEASLQDFQHATISVFIIDTFAESAEEGVTQPEGVSPPNLPQPPATDSRIAEGGIPPEEIMLTGSISTVLILSLTAAAWITLRKRRVEQSEP